MKRSARLWLPRPCGSPFPSYSKVSSFQGGSAHRAVRRPPDLRSAARVLAQAENNELSRLDRRQANVDEELAPIPNVRRIQLFVALDKEGLRRSGPEQHAFTPQPGQERAD